MQPRKDSTNRESHQARRRRGRRRKARRVKREPRQTMGDWQMKTPKTLWTTMVKLRLKTDTRSYLPSSNHNGVGNSCCNQKGNEQEINTGMAYPRSKRLFTLFSAKLWDDHNPVMNQWTQDLVYSVRQRPQQDWQPRRGCHGRMVGHCVTSRIGTVPGKTHSAENVWFNIPGSLLWNRHPYKNETKANKTMQA